MQNAGAVRFDDRDGETDLEYAMEFQPPGRTAGEVVAKIFFKDPENQVQRALDAFKELIEREASPRPGRQA